MSSKIPNLIVFRKTDIETIITSLGFHSDEKKIVLNSENEPVRCEICNTAITTENLGNVMPGSKLLYCDNPACFSGYLVKQ